MNGIFFTFYALVIVTLSFIFVVLSFRRFRLLSWLVLLLLSTLCLLLARVCHLSHLVRLSWDLLVLLLLNAGDFLGFAVSVVAPLLVALVVEFVTSLAFTVSQNAHASGAHLALGNLPWALGVRRLSSSPLLLDTVNSHVTLILELILSSGEWFVIILSLGNCSRVRTAAIFIISLSAWIIVSICPHWATARLPVATASCATLNFTFWFIFIVIVMLVVLLLRFGVSASPWLLRHHIFYHLVLFLTFYANRRFEIICHGICSITTFTNPIIFLKCFLFRFFFFILKVRLLILQIKLTNFHYNAAQVFYKAEVRFAFLGVAAFLAI